MVGIKKLLFTCKKIVDKALQVDYHLFKLDLLIDIVVSRKTLNLTTLNQIGQVNVWIGIIMALTTKKEENKDVFQLYYPN